MESKIKNILLILSVVCYSCSSTPSNSSKSPNNSQDTNLKYDTIYFANDLKDKLSIDDAIIIPNGLVLKTQGNGSSTWIENILYVYKSKNKLVLVASTPDNVYNLIHYNGDNLTIEKIAINKPVVEEFKTRKFTAISISDSSYNSGYLIKSILFYRIDETGNVSEKVGYFPQKKENEKKYDFVIKTQCTDDSLIIFKDKNIAHTYY